MCLTFDKFFTHRFKKEQQCFFDEIKKQKTGTNLLFVESYFKKRYFIDPSNNVMVSNQLYYYT